MPHYYDEQHGELKPFKINVFARKKELELWSGGGVFSKKRLDNGTRLLLDTCVLQPDWNVHDLGCGNGVVGIIVKLTEPSCNVVCSDMNNHAITLTRQNAKEHRTALSVVKSDGYEKITQKFDTILVNPPYVAGRKVVFRLLDEAADHLKKGGMLQVVARHTKGGKMIKERLEKLLGNCDDSRKKSGFRVYLATNK